MKYKFLLLITLLNTPSTFSALPSPHNDYLTDSKNYSDGVETDFSSTAVSPPSSPFGWDNWARFFNLPNQVSLGDPLVPLLLPYFPPMADR